MWWANRDWRWSEAGGGTLYSQSPATEADDGNDDHSASTWDLLYGSQEVDSISTQAFLMEIQSNLFLESSGKGTKKGDV